MKTLVTRLPLQWTEAEAVPVPPTRSPMISTVPIALPEWTRALARPAPPSSDPPTKRLPSRPLLLMLPESVLPPPTMSPPMKTASMPFWKELLTMVPLEGPVAADQVAADVDPADAPGGEEPAAVAGTAADQVAADDDPGDEAARVVEVGGVAVDKDKGVDDVAADEEPADRSARRSVFRLPPPPGWVEVPRAPSDATLSDARPGVRSLVSPASILPRSPSMVTVAQV